MLTISQSIKKYNLGANKSLGQNFILDSNLTDKIAKSSGNLNDFEVLEIGPGPAGLTRSILKNNPKKLTVIEKDQRFLPLLEEVKSFYPSKLQIINDDALIIDENKIIEQKPFKIIANLPYNIGTELIFKWLKSYQNIDSMVVLLQKEVAQRIAAKSGSKKYGRLSVMINFLCDTKVLFDISPKSFTPPPKVTSSLIKIIPKDQPLMDINIKTLEKVCQAAFGQRRKMIRSSLKSLNIDVESLLKKCNIDPTLRAEMLSLKQFGTIAKNIDQ